MLGETRVAAAAAIVLSVLEPIRVHAFLFTTKLFLARKGPAAAATVVVAVQTQGCSSENWRSWFALAASSGSSSETPPISGASSSPTEHGTQQAVPAAVVPPQLVQGDREWETFVSRYRVRPKRESERFANAVGKDVWVGGREAGDWNLEGGVTSMRGEAGIDGLRAES